MVLRKLFGDAFEGDALTAKAITDSATRDTDEIHEYIASVSYTHLTLPTKRIV